MPIYFNLNSHLWVFYALIFNGYLLSAIISFYSLEFKKITGSLEAQILSSFFISLLLNGIILFSFDKLNIDFVNSKYVLYSLTLFFVSWLLLKTRINLIKFELAFCESLALKIGLYLCVFIIIFYNGALIDKISDAWWHLSYANKIGFYSTFGLENGHINGVSSRYYPPLWHANLAMINRVSGVSLPIVWNSVTAWVAVLKTMGFYLLALGLSKNNKVALLSAVMFILLPGIGNSYLRASAWPSHISYTAWFCMFFITFKAFDRLPEIKLQQDSQLSFKMLIRSSITYLSNNLCLVLCFFCLSLVVSFTHLAELLWYLIGILFYSIILSIHKIFSSKSTEIIEPAFLPLAIFQIIGFLFVLFLTLYNYMPDTWGLVSPSKILLITISILSVILFVYPWTKYSIIGSIYSAKLTTFTFLLLTMLIVITIDSRQFLSLFNPEMAYPNTGYQMSSISVKGWFNESLILPGWHLQLRGGLLYSGFFAIIISLIMAFYKPSRLTLFLAGNSILTFLFLISPYLYQWLNDLLNYHSSWRIALLFFHPIVFASAISLIIDELRSTPASC